MSFHIFLSTSSTWATCPLVLITTRDFMGHRICAHGYLLPIPELRFGKYGKILTTAWCFLTMKQWKVSHHQCQSLKEGSRFFIPLLLYPACHPYIPLQSNPSLLVINACTVSSLVLKNLLSGMSTFLDLCTMV